MATATASTKTTKSAFLTGFLQKNPTANQDVVNEAWMKAGYTGSVSRSLVGKLRTDLGLSGNTRTKPTTTKPEAQTTTKPTEPRAKRHGRDQGKSSFIKELLVDHPQANADAVNRAWKKAGMKGTISISLVGKVRSDLGLTGNLPKGRKPAVSKKTGGKTKAAGVHAKRHPGNREQMLVGVEDKIDRLIFELLEIGGVEKAEDALRAARRVVVRAQKA
jgi:hypothetical protein